MQLGPQDSTGTKVIETLVFLLNKVVLRHNDRYEDALELVEQALVHYPNYAQLYSMKGIYLQKLGRSQSALEFLLTAINSQYVTSGTLFHLGLAHLDVGDTDIAATAFRKTLAIEPSHRGAELKLKQLAAS